MTTARVGPARRTTFPGDTFRADLSPIKAALAAMSDVELDALMEGAYEMPQTAPGLLMWLDSACLWQMSHRVGYHYELQPPEAAIPPEESAMSIDVANALRATFAQDSPAVRALFDALVDRLAGSDRRKH